MKTKIGNRLFALFFVILTLIFMYYTGYGGGSVSEPTGNLIQRLIFVIFFFSTLGIGITIVLFGLLKEIWKPSLDFTFHRDRSWIFISIILLSVFISYTVWWWVAHGPETLLARGQVGAIIEWFMGSFTIDTSALSLMFGILFLTNSTPQKSSNYKTMLIGALFFESMCFLAYILAIAGSDVVPAQYKNFVGFVVFQPWFWLDLASQVTIFIGAVRLLRTNTNIQKLILIAILYYIVWLFLIMPFLQKLPKPQFS